MKTKVKSDKIVVTLARHERSTMATIIINKLKALKSLRGTLARDAQVQYEYIPGKFQELYTIPAAKFYPRHPGTDIRT